MAVTHNITLDVDKNRMRLDQKVHVRTGDKSSQTVRCALTKDGAAYTPANGTTAYLEVLKPDGMWTKTSATVSGSNVSGVVPLEAMSVPGECKRAYFRLISGSTEDTTEDFYLYVFQNATQAGPESAPFSDQIAALMAGVQDSFNSLSEAINNELDSLSDSVGREVAHMDTTYDMLAGKYAGLLGSVRQELNAMNESFNELVESFDDMYEMVASGNFKFANPIEWRSSSQYSALTAVKHNEYTYVSKKDVPSGTSITNDEYWFLWAEPNAQCERLRADVEDAVVFADTTKYVNRNLNKIVVFSDSTFVEKSSGKNIVEFLQEMSDAEVVSKGVSGTTTNGFISHVTNATDAELADADLIICAYLTNDWQSSRIPIPFAGSSSHSGTVEYNYDRALGILEERAPWAEIICVTPAYIHSTAASSENVLNVNDAGGYWQSYCDVVEHVARSHNKACLRLDKLLGVTEKNYLTQMIVSSGTEIYVHYQNSTKIKIANMLLSCFYGLVNYDNGSSTVDITPSEWGLYACIEPLWLLPETPCIAFRSGGTTLNVPALKAGEYWISGITGPCIIEYDGQIVYSNSDKWTFFQVPITSDGEAAQLKFTAFNSSYRTGVYGLKMSKGRPNIYDSTHHYYAPRIIDSSNDDFEIRVHDYPTISIVNVRHKRQVSIEQYQAIGELPESVIPATSMVGSCIVTSNGAQYNDTLRVGIDRSLYLGTFSGTLSNLQAELIVQKYIQEPQYSGQ